MVFGQRSPYALSPSGVIWEHSGGVEEPTVLRFPAVEVGSVEEEMWCALGSFIHGTRTQNVGARPTFIPRAFSGWLRGLRRDIEVVSFAEIDLLEQSTPLEGWVEPVLEVPPSVLLVERGEEASARDQWVWELLEKALPEGVLTERARKVRVSYSLVRSQNAEGAQDACLLLAVGDLSGKRGWRLLLLQEPRVRGGGLVPPHALVPPEHDLPAAIPALSSPSAMPSAVPALSSDLLAPVPAPPTASSASMGSEDDTSQSEVDPTQMSVDTLEIPTLRQRMLGGRRVRQGARGGHLQVG